MAGAFGSAACSQSSARIAGGVRQGILWPHRFIDERANLIFIGPPGVAKTHQAMVIGQETIDTAYNVLFTSALALVEKLERAEVNDELNSKSQPCRNSTC